MIVMRIFVFDFQIIRRSGPIEQMLVVVKRRQGHSCIHTWLVIALVAWEGVAKPHADMLYDSLKFKLGNFGTPTERR